MTDIHIDVRGAGQPLVFVHGWGLHGGVWEATANSFAGSSHCSSVDLPGFGASPLTEGRYCVESLAESVAAAVPADAIWIGWSLGGLVALAAALGGARIRKLVLVGATPRFVQGPGWPYGIAPEVLDEFATELEIDYRATVQRFLALQARGSDRAREELRTLREKVFARGEPTHAALAGGLEILRTTDLRHTLNHIALPVLLLHGDKDRLVPLGAVDATAAALPDARVTLVAGAGHAPFLSHPAEFQGLLKNFIGE